MPDSLRYAARSRFVRTSYPPCLSALAAVGSSLAIQHSPIAKPTKQQLKHFIIKSQVDCLSCASFSPLYNKASPRDLTVQKPTTMSLTFDEYGRPYIIVREQQAKARLRGLEAQKVRCFWCSCAVAGKRLACVRWHRQQRAY